MTARDRITIAPGLELPPDVVTQVTGILARRGRGKTYTAAVIVEQLVKRGLPVVVLDPTGAWFGIRTSADGRRPGLPVTILGGHYGDVPLEPTAGKVIADLVVDHPAAYVIDLSAFDSKKAEQRFAGDFLEQLYRAKAKPTKRGATLLVVDEADFFAPQSPGPEQTRTLGALESIVRRGRIRGLGALLITQRSAVLNKNVLSQIELLIALQTTDPRDRDAIDMWVKGNGTTEDRERVIGSLASLAIGEAWVWSPTWLGILKRVKIQRRETFDSGKTPEAGAAAVAPSARAKVDLGELEKRIKGTVEQAKANDPNVLKSRLSTLERELAAARAVKPAAAKIERVEVPVLKDAQVAGIERACARLAELGGTLTGVAAELVAALRSVRSAPPARETRIASTAVAAAGLGITRDQLERDIKHSDQFDKKTRLQVQSLGAGEAKILAVIAQRPRGATRELLTVVTGYKRSSRDTYLQRLRQAGLVDEGGVGVIATPSGVAALGDAYKPLPTGDDLVRWWRENLPGGEKVIFELLAENHPRALSRDEIGEHTGYKRSSRDTYLQRLGQRRLIATTNGGIVLSLELFE